MTSAGGPGAGGMRGVGGYWFWTIGATCSIGGRRALRGAGFCWEHSALRVEGGPSPEALSATLSAQGIMATYGNFYAMEVEKAEEGAEEGAAEEEDVPKSAKKAKKAPKEKKEKAPSKKRAADDGAEPKVRAEATRAIRRHSRADETDSEITQTTPS